MGDVFLHLMPHLMTDTGHGIEHKHNDHQCSHQLDQLDEIFHHIDKTVEASFNSNESLPLQSFDRVFNASKDLVFGELKNGMIILTGFVTFFLIERLLRCFIGRHSHHDHSAARKKDDDHKPNEENDKTGLKIAGFLNLGADFMHNVTDGLAIGAAFSSSHALGTATTLSTLFHELPHEIGDYAVLVQSGMSRPKAIFAQFCTAFGALIGTVIGLKSAENADFFGTNALLGFTSGGFIYVSCVSVMPEIINSKSGFLQSLLEIFGFVAGVILMVVVAALE